MALGIPGSNGAAPSYSATSFPGELLWIPKSLDYAKCEKGTALPGILLNCLHARYFVLFLHSNGEDIGMCHTFASRLRDLLEVHVLLVEFPGYGLCSGKPSEDSLQSAADACFRYVREVLQVAPADIIVMGRSMGAAVALSLAEKFYFGGLVLIAPFLSLRDALGQYTGAKMSEMMLDEVFCNKERIKGVKVPTLVIHGQKDRLIDSSQGQQLFDLCPSRKKLFVCPEEMGHNDDLLSDPEFLIRPILRFFPLPDYYFTALRVPKEAFDKRLRPLYHGVVEMTKNHKPLAKVGGDNEEDILPDEVQRKDDPSPRNPDQHGARKGMYQSTYESEDLPGVDLDIGILKYLRSPDLLKDSGYQAFHKVWEAATCTSRPLVDESSPAIVDHTAVIVDHTEVSHSTLGEAAAAPG